MYYYVPTAHAVSDMGMAIKNGERKIRRVCTVVSVVK